MLLKLQNRRRIARHDEAAIRHSITWLAVVIVLASQAPVSAQNFETVILQGANLVHYWKDTSNVADRWLRAAVITSGATGPGSIIQSSFGVNGNFEVSSITRRFCSRTAG
jgi:hypothetical protein